MDLNGLCPLGLLCMSGPEDAPREPVKSSSSSTVCFRRPQTLLATIIKPPIIINPPTETNTPIKVFLVLSLIPELPDPPLPPSMLGVLVTVLVLTATSALVVRTWENVLLPLAVITVVTTCLVALETEVEVVTDVTLDDPVEERDCCWLDWADEEEVPEVVTGPTVELGGVDVACEADVDEASSDEV